MPAPGSHTADLARADEVWLCSTSPCLLAGRCVSMAGRSAVAFPVRCFAQLLRMWGDHVDTDIRRRHGRFCPLSARRG